MYRVLSRDQLGTRGHNTGQCENCGIMLTAPGAVRTHGTLVACLQCQFVHQLTIEDGDWTADALMCHASLVASDVCDAVDFCPLIEAGESWAPSQECPYTPWQHQAEAD